MSKRNHLLSDKGKNSYILSASPQTKSMTEGLDVVDAAQFQMETAKYIERLSADLVVLSTQANMDFLAYLLDMARIEASDRSVKPETGKVTTVK